MIQIDENPRVIYLIDRVLVKVFLKEGDNDLFTERNSGLYIPNQNAKEKAFNFGKIAELPYMVTEERYLELAKRLAKGITIFFSASKSYNYIQSGDEDEFKLLMIPLYDIDAFH